MLVNGNKIKMIKAIPGFDRVGEEFEVSNVSEDGTITIRTSYGVGVMSYKEFENHFELVKEYKWVKLSEFFGEFEEDELEDLAKLSIGSLVDIEIQTDCEYFIKLKYGFFEVGSYLHPEDEFDRKRGINICICRLNEQINKFMLKQLTR
ncbi:MAG: hypothetical protein ACRCTZ_05925 [Sarcina sp.]